MDEEVAAYKGLDPKDQKYLLVQALPPSTRTFGPQRLGQGPKPDLQRKTHLGTALKREKEIET